MRFMVIVKGNPQSESGQLPDEKILKEMNDFNEQLVKAGVILAMDGLHPTKDGVRVRFQGKQRMVIDGPFTETKEIIAGFWIWRCRSRAEAVEWLKRAPFEDGAEVEIRQIYEAEDFAPVDPSGEIRKKEEALRNQIDSRR